MTDFVRDATSLPTGKTDARPLTGPAAQHVTAAEWNTAMQAVLDTRTALRETFDVRNYGANAALTDNTNSVAFQAAITAAEAVGGVVLIPAGTWTLLTELRISGRVNIIGAGMDKTILLAGTSMRSVLYVYFTVAAGTARLEHFTLDANGNATSAMYCHTASFMQVDGVRFVRAKKDGVRLAAITRLNYTSGTGLWSVGQVVTGGTSGATGIIDRITGTTSGYIEMETISTSGTFVHGENLLTSAVIRAVANGGAADSSANDKMHFVDCWMDRNGTMYRTSGIGAITQNLGIDTVTPGTVSTTITSDQVVGVGTSFTTMGLRQGDILRVGTSGNMEFLMIDSVQDDTHITLTGTSLAAQTRNTQPFAIGVGDGYHEDNSSENNINHISGGLFRGNSGAQLFFNGLYGPNVEHCQIDYVPSYAVIVNDGTAGKTVASSTFTHLYIESVLGGGFFFDAATGVTVNGLLGAGTGKASNGIVTADPPRWRTATDDRVSGVYLAGGTITTDDAIEGIGGALCTMEVTDTANQKPFDVKGCMQLIQDSGTLVAGTTITPTRSHLRFDIAGNVTMTATPTIATSGAGVEPGRLFLLTNGDSTDSLTVQDEGTLGSSGLVLGRPTLVIAPGESALFVLQVNNRWFLLAHTGNKIAGASAEGIVTAAAQTFGGDKTFNGEIRQASGYFRGASASSGAIKVDDSVGTQMIYGAGSLALTATTLTTNVQTRMASLGVGNSASATTPGTVTKKIEVFDASGASLGFVAVYDAIT